MDIKVFLSVSILLLGISVYAQQEVPQTEVPVAPKQEEVVVPQVDNSDLVHRVASLEKEVDRYRDDLMLWLGLFVGIITIVSGFVGIAFPMIYNNKVEKRLTEQVDKSIDKMDQSHKKVEESIGNVNASIKGFDAEKSTAMASLKSTSDSLLNEIQAEKDELKKLKEAISEMQKDFREKGNKVIEEVREQTGAKVDELVDEKVSSSIMAILSQKKIEAETNNTEENV